MSNHNISGLRDWQEEVFTDPTRFRTACCGRRSGKLFSPDTDILTANRGWIKFGNIAVGDKVFDENGEPCNVTGVFHPEEEKSGKMYKLKFEASEDIKTCGDHQWVTWTHRDRKQFARKDVVNVKDNGDFPPKDWVNFRGDIYDRQGNPCSTYGAKQRSTQEIVDTFTVGKRKDSNHSIPVCGQLNFPEKDLPIDPYLFGYFLGDGTKNSGLFTINKTDQEPFLTKVKNLGYEVSFRKDELSVYLLGFLQQIKKHGVASKDAIPDDYKFCSAAQRLELLKGLMDSDGYSSEKCIEFSAKRKEHAELVHYLLVSLGQKATISEKMSKLYGRECGIVYRVSCSPSINVFSLPRKVERSTYDTKTARRMRQKHRMLRNYEEIEWVKGSLCITVDSPNSMYLIGKNLIPTHNTTLALNELIRAAQAGYKQTVWYVAPTYKMAKRIMWRMLKEAIPPSMIKSKNEQDLEIILDGYESVIALKGCEDPDSLRGDSLSFMVVDECQDILLDTIDTVLRPSLSDQFKFGKGDALFIGTPKGMGDNAMYKLHLRGKTEPDWASWIVKTADTGNVPLEEIEAARRVMSLTKFRQEYEASFEAVQGRVYYNFDAAETIKPTEDLGTELYIGLDFNVSKMCSAIGIKVADEFHVIDEIVIENSNTREMCNEIKRRYPNRKITVYPDPSGKSRKTSAGVGQTDFTIIREFGFSLIAPTKAPLVADRINCVNALLMNASLERKLFVDPKCKEVIACLDGQLYKAGTNIPDKDNDKDHMNDALGYIITSEFNLVTKTIKLFNLNSVY